MTTAETTTNAMNAFDFAYGRRRSDEPIMAADPDAQRKLAERIKHLENIRQAMKDIKAAVRLKAVVTGNERLRAMGLNDTMIEKCRGEGRSLFPAYILQNLGANITRLRTRLENVEAEAKRAPAEDVEHDGYRVVENTHMSRIQLVFDAKPDADTRAMLKRKGFRWAPSQDAWQRHLNANGRNAVRHVAYALRKAAEAAAA